MQGRAAVQRCSILCVRALASSLRRALLCCMLFALLSRCSLAHREPRAAERCSSDRVPPAALSLLQAPLLQHYCYPLVSARVHI